MAHQLSTAYTTACVETIHGHSYILELFFSSSELNRDGMVVDFGEVKTKAKPIIDKFDHALVLPDIYARQYTDMLHRYNEKLLVVDYNPTAEQLSFKLYESIKEVLPSLKKVRLHETDNGYAEYEGKECSVCKSNEKK